MSDRYDDEYDGQYDEYAYSIQVHPIGCRLCDDDEYDDRCDRCDDE